MKNLFIILAALVITEASLADTARMEKVAEQLGIDSAASSQGSKEAKAAVERLVLVGVKAYPTVKEREADVAARQSEKDAAVANYQPILSINANASRQDGKDTDTNIKNHSDGRDVNLILRQNLYRGGIDSGRVGISEQNLLISENNQLFETENLDFSIRRAALEFNYRSLRQLIDDVSFEDARDLRNLAQRKLDAGQVGKIDLYTTTMRESTAKASAARSAIESSQARERLTTLLGPSDQKAELSGDVELLKNRILPYPEVMPNLASKQVKTFEERNAEAVAKRADITLDQGYRERFLPSLDLVAQLSRSKNSTYYSLENDFDNRVNSSGTFIQLQFNWTLWDRRLDHLNKASAQEKLLADAQSATARYTAESEVTRIKVYIQDLYNNLGTAIEAYKASGQLYDAQRRLYETGVIGIQPLIDAEAEKRNAIATWHQNVYELQLNLLIWDALKKGFVPNV
ncbi:MAG: TolC family protein [Proteobacteria bacterium]|nr:MAG: TolC family protein [Pseudomonadota bacterium]